MKAIQKLILNRAIKFSQGVSGDGKPLEWTLDLRELLLSPDGKIITEQIKKKLRRFDSRQIGGITMASSLITGQVLYLDESTANWPPLVTDWRDAHFTQTSLQMIIFHLHYPSIERWKMKTYKGFFIRYKRKKHGLRKEIEGEFDKDKPVIIVDDVINDNGFVFEAIKRIENNGGSVEGVVAIVDYCNKGLEKLKKKCLKVEYLCNLKDIYLINDKIKAIETIPPKKEAIDLPQFADTITEPLIDDKIYVGGSIGARAGVFCAFEYGKLTWKHKIKANVKCKPAASDKIYFGCDDKHLYALDKQGKLKWKLNCKRKLRGGIVLIDNHIYTGTKDGFLLCIKDKKIAWEKKLGKEIKLPLTTKKDELYVATNNRLFCFQNETIKWLYNAKIEDFKDNVIKSSKWFRLEE